MQTKQLKGPDVVEITDEAVLTKVRTLVAKYDAWSEEEDGEFDGPEPGAWDYCDSWPIYDLGFDSMKIMGSGRVVVADGRLFVMSDNDACIGWKLQRLLPIIPELQELVK